MSITKISGQFGDFSTTRVVLVSSRFNELVVKGLVDGAIETLRRFGVEDAHMLQVEVPGALEIPLAAREAIDYFAADAVIALGAVIRGETAHFDYVCAESAAGLSRVSAESGLPVINAILTVDNLEQALARAGSKAGNKGSEAAQVALEMVDLSRQLTQAAP